MVVAYAETIPLGCKRRYTTADIARVQAYAQTAPSILAVAEDTNIPYMTVHNWLSGETQSMPDVTETVKARENLADRYEDLIHKVLDVAPGKIEAASFAALLTGAGIATDKMRLLREQSTSNLLTNLSENEAQERAATILAKAAKKLEAQRQVSIEAQFTDVQPDAEISE